MMVSPWAIQALFCLVSIYGYRQLDTNEKRGHLLIGISSAGLVFFAPNLVYVALSMFWVWESARKYKRCSNATARVQALQTRVQDLIGRTASCAATGPSSTGRDGRL